MIGPFDYQQRIRECQQWAEKAANDRAKGVWREMERFWCQRAILNKTGALPDLPSKP